MSLQIIPLEQEHLADAAALVSARYRTLRQCVPVLPPRYAAPDPILDLLRGLAWDTAGVAALRDGQLAGFLWGLTMAEFLGKRSAYSPEWANAADPEDSRRIYTEMYAHLAGQWAAAGCPIHVVTMLAHDQEGIEAWQCLGFGLANADAVRDLTLPEGVRADVQIRRAAVADAAAAQALSRALEKHLAAAPVFWLHELDDYNEWLQEPDNALWLAYDGDETVGFMALGPGYDEGCAISQDEQTVSISGAYTLDKARGRGVATALLDHALAWAREQEYARCALDFETANVPAARFWPKWFEPVCYSLIRWIDERAM
jgi:GNAT superfamily N-acetyltransferase